MNHLLLSASSCFPTRAHLCLQFGEFLLMHDRFFPPRLLSSGSAARWKERQETASPRPQGGHPWPHLDPEGQPEWVHLSVASPSSPALSLPVFAPSGHSPPPYPSSSHAGVQSLFVPCWSGNGATGGTRVGAQGVSGRPAEIRRTHAGTQDGS